MPGAGRSAPASPSAQSHRFLLALLVTLGLTVGLSKTVASGVMEAGLGGSVRRLVARATGLSPDPGYDGTVCRRPAATASASSSSWTLTWVRRRRFTDLTASYVRPFDRGWYAPDRRSLASHRSSSTVVSPAVNLEPPSVFGSSETPKLEDRVLQKPRAPDADATA